jgi:hypothetical protein
LYAELHRCDERGAELIIVEAPPPGEAWRAIADRLERAAHIDPPVERDSTACLRANPIYGEQGRPL